MKEMQFGDERIRYILLLFRNLNNYYMKKSNHPGVFAMRRIRAVNEIYPVFHDLFKKRV